MERRVLPGRRRHLPPPFPPMRYPVLHWPAYLQRSHCNPSHASLCWFYQPSLHHTKNGVKGESIGHGRAGLYKDIRWRHCVVASHIFKDILPPEWLLLQTCVTRISGYKLEALRSRPSSKPSSKRQDRQSISLLKTLVRVPFEWEMLWRSSQHGWTRTRSGLVGGIGSIKCSATSTRHQQVSQTSSQSVCFSTATTHSYCQNTPPYSAKRYRRIHANRPSRGFWKSGIGLLWTHQLINRPFSPHAVYS